MKSMTRKWMQRVLTIALALTMLLGAAACGDSGTTEPTGTGSATTTPPTASTTAPTTSTDVEEIAFYVADNDEEIYMNNFGAFYDAYLEASAASSVAQRHALLAVAEAKALQAAGCAPMYGSASGYSMTRLVYRCGGYASWRGGMNDYSQFVLTNEIITTEDYAHLRQLNSELSGTGTYMTKAMEYLTEKGYTFNDSYVGTFSATPTTWNLLAGTTMTDLSFTRPLLDYLLSYDPEGTLTPHLATGYEILDGGKTYVIHIREGVSWVDSQGRKVAELCADDWVASAQHRADVGAAWTLGLYIEGLTDYANGTTTDFSTVGVKAIDKYTLEYTLVEPMTYFHTMFESNDFLPLCRSYFLSQGGAFGLEEYAEASASPSYTFGIDQNHISSVGKFICTNMTDKNSVTYVLNESYWNNDNDKSPVKNVKLVYYDGTDVSMAYENFKSGVTVSLGLGTPQLKIATENGDFDKYAITGDVGRSSFLFWFNMNRQTYANVADGAAPSQKTDAEKEVSRAAMQNRHFRLAICYAIDRATYVSVSTGEELKNAGLRNTITPGTYVALESDATIKINDTSVTFPAGTWYGEIVQAQLDADGFPVKVWNAQTQNTDGWDAWHNPELAAAELEIAIKELASIGYEVTAQNPIVVDYPYVSYNEVSQNQAYILKTCIETALNGLVRFDLLPLNNTTELYNVENNTNRGAERNTDMGGLGSIGSAHGDPKCYTEGLLPFGDGTLTQRMGLW